MNNATRWIRIGVQALSSCKASASRCARRAVVVLAGTIPLTPVMAADFEWVGSGGIFGLYEVPAHWLGGTGPPGATDTALFNAAFLNYVGWNDTTGAVTNARAEVLNNLHRWENVAGNTASYDVTGDILVNDGGFLAISALSVTTPQLTVGSTSNATFLVENGFAQPGVGGSMTTTNTVVGESGASAGLARVVGAGATWTNTGNLTIGLNGNGSLSIEAGGLLSNGQGIVAGLDNSIGNATVTGAGSTWNNTSGLDVGRRGAGTLTIEDGGVVSSANGFLARQTNSTGTVNISGAGSRWDVAGTLEIGRANFGAGILNLGSDGALDTGSANIANNTGAGSGTVTIGDGGGSSTWTNGTTIYVGGSVSGAGGSGALNIVTGGEVVNGSEVVVWGPGTVDTTGGGTLNTDSVHIAGGTVNSTAAIIDASRVSTGSGQVIADVVTLSGGGTWTNANVVSVGRSSTGGLTVGDGSSLSNTEGVIGELEGSNGTALVTGPGSTWTNTGNLDVGRLGTAQLTVADGGVVSSSIGFVGRQAASGTVQITGAGSQWNMSGLLYVGWLGDATLDILSGGSLTSGNADIARAGGRTSTVTVGDGIDTSTWTNAGDLNVAGDGSAAGGSGMLTVAAGGVISNAGTLRVWGPGMVALDGGEITTQSFLADEDFSEHLRFVSGEIVIDGGSYSNGTNSLFGFPPSEMVGGPALGSRTLTLDNGATAVIAGADRSIGGGLSGAPDDTVNILNGSVFMSGAGTTELKVDAGDTVTINVEGAGSIWTHAGDLIVGGSRASVDYHLNAGDSLLRASEGGLIEMGGPLYVGGTGTVQLAGGAVTADSIILDGVIEGFGTVTGLLSGRGAVTVPGDGGVLLRYQPSSIHAHGGTLTIGDSARSQSFRTDGLVTVDAGATLNIESLANFNRLGPLTQLNGGVLTSNTGVVLDAGRIINGEGEVDTRIVALGGSSIIATGTLALGKFDAFDGFFSDGVLEVGNHEVTINDRDEAVLGSLTTIGNANGAGTLIAPNGILVEFGKTISGYGTVGGDILNNGLINGEGPGLFDFLDLNGLVSGVGDFGGTVAFSGGFSPGLSPTITNGTNLIFNSFLEMELGGLTPGSEHDQIDATGFVVVGGILDVVLINGWVPELGDLYTLILAEQIVSQSPTGDPTAPAFAAINFPELEAGLRFLLDFNLDPSGRDSLVLRVAAVPLPGALWLALGGLAVVLRRRGRNVVLG